MSDIVKATGGALAADMANKLLSGIGQSRQTTIISGGDPLLRLLRHGEWVYGQEDTPIEDGALWAVNPLSIEHGYSCWSNYDEKGKKNELLGEVMAPIFEPKPAKPEPKTGADGVAYGFSEQRTFRLRCVNGEDEGVEVLHKVSSVGGMRAVDGLLAAIQQQLVANPGYPCPVISLDVDSYNHNKWGKVFVPIFTIEGWADMYGKSMPEGGAPQIEQGRQAEPEQAAEPEPTQRRRRGASAASAPAQEEAPPPAQQPQQADAPQRTGMPRRRPGQR